MPVLKAIDDKTFEVISQASHVWFGLAWILVGARFTHGVFGWPLYLISVALVAFAVVKEYWWDVHNETVEVQGSALLDTSTLILGGVIGWGVLLVTR